jgi:alanyl-tRNA synthetase
MVLTPLPKPSDRYGDGVGADCGVLQGKLSNYESDLFTPLIARAAELTGWQGLELFEEGRSSFVTG